MIDDYGAWERLNSNHISAIVMFNVLELNCLLLGEDAEHVFQVEIRNDKTFATLKKFIKEEKSRALRDVDASRIKIWRVRVTIPADDDDLSDQVETEVVSKGRALRGAVQLSALFPTACTGESARRFPRAGRFW